MRSEGHTEAALHAQEIMSGSAAWTLRWRSDALPTRRDPPMEWVTHLLAQACARGRHLAVPVLERRNPSALLLQVARPKVPGSSNRIFVLAAEDSETAR